MQKLIGITATTCTAWRTTSWTRTVLQVPESVQASAQAKLYYMSLVAYRACQRLESNSLARIGYERLAGRGLNVAEYLWRLWWGNLLGNCSSLCVTRPVNKPRECHTLHAYKMSGDVLAKLIVCTLTHCKADSIASRYTFITWHSAFDWAKFQFGKTSILYISNGSQW